MKLGTQVGHGPGHPTFDIYGRSVRINRDPCILGPNGWMAGWIKMNLGVEVDLGPDHIMLDGDPASLFQRGTAPANFWLMSVVAKRLDGP